MAHSHWCLKDERFAEIWQRAQPFTMTSLERGYALYLAVKHLVSIGNLDTFVECGVWRGGSSMIMALTLLECDVSHVNLVLFDTFDGMTPPGIEDSDVHGASAVDLMAGSKGDATADLVRARAGLDEVKAAMDTTGYDASRIRYVVGDVGDTILQTQTGRISLLRLDTDFYDSTRAELEGLYPRVAKGGIVLIDDYGHWMGCNKAVDEYFSTSGNSESTPLMWPIDYTGRGFVKPEPAKKVDIERYDRIPPNYHTPDLKPHFPHIEVRNPYTVGWEFLRSVCPHVFRVDSRNPKPWAIGIASQEEAAVLHTLAAQFKGKRALEIGAHFGWSTAHILYAGVNLDCVDPAFEDPERFDAVTKTLKTVVPEGKFKLWAGSSPEIVPQVSADQDEPWSFVFIDGNHDGDAPSDDAKAVLDHFADDAVAVMHDLASPHVARALAVFDDAGWNTCIFNTMQIMGVAWRGDVSLPDYASDPNTPWPHHDHLARFNIK